MKLNGIRKILGPICFEVAYRYPDPNSLNEYSTTFQVTSGNIAHDRYLQLFSFVIN